MTRPGGHWLELKIPPAAVVLILAGLMFAVSRALPGLSFSLPGKLVIAVTLMVLGGALAFAGVVAFRSRRTTVNPLTPGAASSLVSGSVYRFSRNPMYLGFLLALAGWAAYLANIGSALLLPAFVLYMNRFQIVPEERALLATFGGGFSEYTSRVRRWL